MDMSLGTSAEYDKKISAEIAKLAELRPFGEIEQAFPVYMRRQILSRFLAYYELFRLVKDMPGWIAECGVYRGFSLFALAKFMEIFCMGDKTRKVIGFDNFKGFTELNDKDGGADLKCTRHEGGTNPSEFREEFFKLMELSNNDCFAPWANRMKVIEGDIRVTLPKFCKENPGLRLSMLNIDVDIYEPVVTSLENLYPRLLPGGIVVLDEFAHIDWPGESEAFLDVFKKNSWPVPKLQTFSWVSTPTTYFIKEHL
jgi:hypothetical protein